MKQKTKMTMSTKIEDKKHELLKASDDYEKILFFVFLRIVRDR